MIDQYDVIKDENNHPKLLTVSSFPAENDNLMYDDGANVYFLNKYLHLGEMDSEHLFVIAYSEPFCVGLYLLSLGDFEETSPYSNRNLLMFLALTGANAFRIFHNHPNGVLEASGNDKSNSMTMKTFADYMGIKFLGSLIITKDGWCDVDDEITFSLSEWKEANDL